MRRLLLLLALLATPAMAQEAFDCVIDPSATLKLGSPVSGLLAEVLVERGDFVTAGQELARLESGIDAATVELDALQAESTEQLNSAQTKLELAQSRLARTPISLAWRRISRVSRDGLNTRSSWGSTTVPGRSARGWVRNKAAVLMSRISMRRA